MAMMSDAISHSILFGIVIAFFITKDLSSPFLIVAAALTGVLTVSLVELLNRTKLVREDAAIGLVFPVLFSIGVILISRHAGKVHLDIDAVLLGELAFAPFNRFEIFGHDIGPRSFYVMAGILMLNVIFILLYYKELKLSTFDVGLATALGFAPALVHYGLMSLVSLTAVGAFDAVGSILVVALMVGPPVSAYLLTDRLSHMLFLSAVFGIIGAISGYWMAHLLDASIAGSMATMVGFVFLIVYLAAPDRGLIASANRRARQKIEFAVKMLAVHLLHHEGLPEAEHECHITHLPKHFLWDKSFIQKILKIAEKEKILNIQNEFLQLTGKGRQMAKSSMVN
jgi:manganese/zinc/iron transport system permease protein